MLPLQNTRSGSPAPLRFLIYGAAGSGKTSAAATFPRPLFVDCEGGLLSVSDQGVDYVRCRSLPDLLEALATVRVNAERFETVVVDSLSEVARLAIDANRRAEGSTSSATPSLAEWGRCIHTVRQVIRAFCALPLHVVFTALPRQLRGPSGDFQGMKPWLPGRLADDVAAAMDFVLFLYTKESGDERALQRGFLTAAHRKVFAKDRSGKLPLWVDPTWPALASHLGIALVPAADAA